MNISKGLTLGESKIGLLIYAEDTIIIGDSIEIIQKL